MLPLPNLDDRTFEQLVREARDLIPGIFPDWTDENVHDPGITLLEMLAWHIEMQQYQLDRLTVRHERKFLKLLGEELRDRQPSRTSVTFAGVPRTFRVAEGTVLRGGELPFETERTLTVFPAKISRMTVHTVDGSRDVTVSETGGTPFYPFGPEAKAGSQLEILFEDPLPAGVSLSLWVDLVEEETGTVRRIPSQYSLFVPSGFVSWMYWDESEDGTQEWKPIALERDDTYSLHQSGTVRFLAPGTGIRRIAAVMSGGVYDSTPIIRRLLWNEVPVLQGRTLSCHETFDSSGLPHQSFAPQHALFEDGALQVQVKKDDGSWVDWERTLDWPASALPVFKIERSADTVTVVFGNGENGAIPPAGNDRIRVIAVAADFVKKAVCGAARGISGQTCPLPVAPVFPDRLLLQIGWLPEGASSLVWQDWERVRDFDRSGPDSLHYVVDDEEGFIRFSDGVSGAVPPSAPLPNIRLIGCRIGGGEVGNVKEGQVRIIERGMDAEALQISNVIPAEGGAEPETVAQAMIRVQRSVLDPDCGVTAEDVERIVMGVPGQRIVRTKAIPGFRPGLHQYPAERAFGHISVVVVPCGKGTLPRPSEGMLQTVRNHLEPYRLLTTKFHVIPPEYVVVSVRAIVVVDPRYEGRERGVKEALDRLFQPYGNNAGAVGWEFGRSVYKGDVFDAIHRVPGVNYIQDVWLMADGKDVHREEGGDIRIPPNALVVSGQHEIEFLSSLR